MYAFIYQTKIWDPSASALTASFVRITVNFIVVLWFAAKANGLKGLKQLWGNRRWSLWGRGLFGGLSLICVIYAVQEIGIADASFLQNSNSVWIGFIAPFYLRQKNSTSTWIALTMGLVGTYLIYQPELGSAHFVGKTIAIASGFFSAIAFMMIARVGRSNSSLTVVFYFCLVTIMIHLLWFIIYGFTPPQSLRALIFLVLAGLAGSGAQIFMTKSYQLAPAAIVSAVSNAQPVMSLALGMMVFGDRPNVVGLAGAFIVLLSGVALPLIAIDRSKP